MSNSNKFTTRHIIIIIIIIYSHVKQLVFQKQNIFVLNALAPDNCLAELSIYSQPDHYYNDFIS